MAEQIINLLRSFKLEDIYTNQIKTVKRPIGKIIDSSRAVNNVFTDFVVSDFIKSELVFTDFVQLIITLHNQVIDAYVNENRLQKNDIIFVFKGGNILRNLANNSLENMPGEAKRIFTEKLADAFKKSDIDFSIYINPKLTTFDKVYKDMINTTYLVQLHIRTIIASSQYFDYDKLQDILKQDKLKELIPKLNETDTIKNRIDDYSPVSAVFYKSISSDNKQYNYKIKQNFYVKYSESYLKDKSRFSAEKMDEINNIKLKDIQNTIFSTNTSPNMYTSVNDALSFGEDYITHFCLVRTKLIFYIVMNDKIKKSFGELIDVTVIAKDDAYLEHMFDHLSENIKTYTFSNGFKFQGYSLEYSIYDLEKILFNQNEFPWLDEKYEKRVRRLIYLYLLKLLTNNNADAVIVYRNLAIFKTQVIDALRMKLITGDKNMIDILNAIRQFAINENGKIIENHDNMPLWNFSKKIYEIVEKDTSDQDSLMKFLDIIDKNITIMQDITRQILIYIKFKGHIDEKSIYAK